MVGVIVGAMVGVSGCMILDLMVKKDQLIDKAKLSLEQRLFHTLNCLFLFLIDLNGLGN
jgi:hypothetical protein